MRSVGGTRQGDGVGRWFFFFFCFLDFKFYGRRCPVSGVWYFDCICPCIVWALRVEEGRRDILRVKDRPDRKAVQHCTGNVVIIIIINRIDFLFYFFIFFPPFLSEVS